MEKRKDIKNEVSQALAVFQTDPFLFIEEAFSIVPQPPKEETYALLNELLACPLDRFEQIAGKLTLDDFQPFVKNKHLTWQQTIILIAYARALNGTLPWRIVALTGRGAGKGRTASYIVYHMLYSFPQSIVMATAVTGETLYAALWKELALVLSDMNEPFKSSFEWQSHYIRHKESPATWFARAKTADTVEALRGVHSDTAMLSLCDEASAVDEEVIKNGVATMTCKTKILLLLSNPSGNDSLVERVFEENAANYIKLRFSTEDSPIVDQEEIKIRKADLIAKGINPEKDRDYCIDILGIPPPDSSEVAGWYRFIPDALIDHVLRPVSPLDNPDYRQRPALGVDPAGEGHDNAPGVLRSFKWAKTIFEQSKSSSDSIAGAIAMVLDNVPQLSATRVFVDSFGVGHDVGQKVLAQSAENKRRVIRAVLVGEGAPDSYRSRYINMRAMLYDAVRVWFENGGRIETDSPDAWRKELKSIYAKKTASGKLQIMSKAEMRAKKMDSPGNCDALSLSFFMDSPLVIDGIYRPLQQTRNDGYGYTATEKTQSYNPHSLIPNQF